MREHAGEAGDQSFAGDATDLKVTSGGGAETAEENLAEFSGALSEVFGEDEVDGCERGGAADGVAGVAGGHAERRVKVEDVGTAGDGGEGEGTGDAFAEDGEVGGDAVVLEAPELARAAKAGLNFVEDEQGFFAGAPLAEAAHEIGRGEGGTAALIGFHDDASDGLGLDIVFTEGAFEAFERGVAGTEAVGEGDLDEAGVGIDDPLLEFGNAAGLLGAESAAVEGLFKRHDDVLGAAAGFDAEGAAEFDGAFDGLGAGGIEEDLFEGLGEDFDEARGEAGSGLIGERESGEEMRLSLAGDGVGDFFAAVAGVSDQDS